MVSASGLAAWGLQARPFSSRDIPARILFAGKLPEEPEPGEGADTFQRAAAARESSEVEYVLQTAPPATPFDRTPIDGAEIIVFDIETTGLVAKESHLNGSRNKSGKKPGDPLDDIIQIAAFKYKNGVLIESLERYVKPMPGNAISPEIEKLTGISNAQVQAEGVEARVAMRELANFVGDSPILVGHNAKSFDTAFIRAVYARLGMEAFKERFNYDHVADTLLLARKLYPKSRAGQDGSPMPENHKLGTLARFFGLDASGAHQADKDVAITAEILKRLIAEIRKQGIQLETFGDLFGYQFSPRKVPINRDQDSAA